MTLTGASGQLPSVIQLTLLRKTKKNEKNRKKIENNQLIKAPNSIKDRFNGISDKRV